MKKEWYSAKIKECKGNGQLLLAINMKLATDVELNSTDKQSIFKEIKKAKK